MTQIPPLLLVDDEPQLLRSTAIALRTAGLGTVATLADSRAVLDFVAEHGASVVLLDLNMPYLSGEQLLRELKEQYPEIPVIVLTAANQVETAVACMRAGASDYLVKPVEKTRLLSAFNTALENSALRAQVEVLKRGLLGGEQRAQPEAFEEILTQSDAMLALFHYTESISRSQQPVLITGETGTGKELFAHALHRASGRSGEFVAINVAGLDDINFSDTLFGHKRGAFTGADQKREGLVAAAREGTLFLDEIGDLAPASQVKLLRLLQEREYYPLGDDQPRSSSARVVVATHVNLAEAVAEGRFRKDLYFRLRPHHVAIPALRERLEDLPLLVEYFFEQASRELDRRPPPIPPALYQLLGAYHFPGNVRELEGMVVDALARHQGGSLNLQPFKEHLGLDEIVPQKAEAIFDWSDPSGRLPTLKEAEEYLIDTALNRAAGNQGVAAGLLGITRQALNKRLVRARDR